MPAVWNYSEEVFCNTARIIWYVSGSLIEQRNENSSVLVAQREMTWNDNDRKGKRETEFVLCRNVSFVGVLSILVITALTPLFNLFWATPSFFFWQALHFWISLPVIWPQVDWWIGDSKLPLRCDGNVCARRPATGGPSGVYLSWSRYSWDSFQGQTVIKEWSVWFFLRKPVPVSFLILTWECFTTVYELKDVHQQSWFTCQQKGSSQAKPVP